MPQSMVTSGYSFSGADLIQKADTLLRAIKRDMDRFAAYDINKVSLIHFKQLIEAFANSCPDERLLRLCKKAEDEKNKTANILRRMLDNFHNMAQLAFNGKGDYHMVDWGNISNMGDKDLCILAKNVRRAATRLLPQLKPVGITDGHWEALASFENALGAKENAYHETLENREREAKERTQKGNALYTELIRLASMGKSLYEGEDEARYNDYAMIEESGGSNIPQSDPALAGAMADNT